MANDSNNNNNNNSTDPNRFTHQNSTAEDLLKSQTVGLVQLSDFRKRRAEALEQKEREAQEIYLAKGIRGDLEGKVRPNAGTGPKKKKVKKLNEQSERDRQQQRRKNGATKGKLSFASDDDDEKDDVEEDQPQKTEGLGAAPAPAPTGKEPKVTSQSMGNRVEAHQTHEQLNANTVNSVSPEPAANAATNSNSRLGPNRTLPFQPPKVMTKSALLRDAQLRDHLRKEFLAMQAAVRATEIAIPFVFYDGINVPGGVCRVKKGDHVWAYLDKARKVGARNGVRGGGDRSKKQWARVGVDDLLLVRGGVIIPHHYEFYYFILNKTVGFRGPLFNYSAEATAATPSAPVNGEGDEDDEEYNLASFAPLSKPGSRKDQHLHTKSSNAQEDTFATEELEGFKDDPNMTKVVDRRWYERNKHIFPASIWEDFDPDKDFSKEIPKDAHGNAFFFS